MVKILELLSNKNRLFLPFQIGFEFHKNYFGEIEQSRNFFKVKNNELDSIKNKIEEMINNDKRIKDKKEEILKRYNDFSDFFIDIIKREEPDFTEVDIIRDHLVNFFKGKTGNEPSDEELKKIKEKGEARFKEKIPPGYEDKNKDSNKYGDFIIWEQILEYSKSNKVPVIFITNDSKKDWWLHDKNKNVIQPLPLLIKEFNQLTKNEYYQYQADSFIRYAKEYLNKSINDTSIKETGQIVEEDKKKDNMADDLIIMKENDIISARFLDDVIDNEFYTVNSDRFPNNQIDPEEYKKFLASVWGVGKDDLSVLRNAYVKNFRSRIVDAEKVKKLEEKLRKMKKKEDSE